MKKIYNGLNEIINGMKKKEINFVNNILFFLLLGIVLGNLVSSIVSWSIMGMLVNLSMGVWLGLMNPFSFKEHGLDKDKESVYNFGMTVGILFIASVGVMIIINILAGNLFSTLFQLILIVPSVLYTKMLFKKSE